MERDALAVADDDVYVVKWVDDRGGTTPLVKYEVTNDRAHEVTVRIEESLPSDVRTNDVAFNPPLHGDDWEIRGSTLAFEKPVSPGRTLVSGFAVRPGTVDDHARLLTTPTIEISDGGGSTSRDYTPTRLSIPVDDSGESPVTPVVDRPGERIRAAAGDGTTEEARERASTPDTDDERVERTRESAEDSDQSEDELIESLIDRRPDEEEGTGESDSTTDDAQPSHAGTGATVPDRGEEADDTTAVDDEGIPKREDDALDGVVPDPSSSDRPADDVEGGTFDLDGASQGDAGSDDPGDPDEAAGESSDEPDDPSGEADEPAGDEGGDEPTADEPADDEPAGDGPTTGTTVFPAGSAPDSGTDTKPPSSPDDSDGPRATADASGSDSERESTDDASDDTGTPESELESDTPTPSTSDSDGEVGSSPTPDPQSGGSERPLESGPETESGDASPEPEASETGDASPDQETGPDAVPSSGRDDGTPGWVSDDEPQAAPDEEDDTEERHPAADDDIADAIAEVEIDEEPSGADHSEEMADTQPEEGPSPDEGPESEPEFEPDEEAAEPERSETTDEEAEREPTVVSGVAASPSVAGDYARSDLADAMECTVLSATGVAPRRACRRIRDVIADLDADGARYDLHGDDDLLTIRSEAVGTRTGTLEGRLTAVGPWTRADSETIEHTVSRTRLGGVLLVAGLLALAAGAVLWQVADATAAVASATGVQQSTIATDGAQSLGMLGVIAALVGVGAAASTTTRTVEKEYLVRQVHRVLFEGTVSERVRDLESLEGTYTDLYSDLDVTLSTDVQVVVREDGTETVRSLSELPSDFAAELLSDHDAIVAGSTTAVEPLSVERELSRRDTKGF